MERQAGAEHFAQVSLALGDPVLGTWHCPASLLGKQGASLLRSPQIGSRAWLCLGYATLPPPTLVTSGGVGSPATL